MYSEKVLDHFQNPRNVGEIENPDGVGQAGNPKCGDIMKIYLRVEDDIITDIKFKTFGCASAIASSSMATELVKGRSIDERPAIVEARTELGHWEADTVIGRKSGKEAAVLTLVERVTNHYLAIRIPGKNSESVIEAMEGLRAEYGERFSSVFKSITTDNGSEFEDFSTLENWGSAIYFAHPYSSWERPVNERHNGLLRQYIPKGVSIENYSPDDVLHFADELNSRPRKRLGYQTPEELFDAFLDSLYAA